MNISENLSEFTNQSRKITLRQLIIIFSIILSSFLYTYFMDFYNSENDFIKKVWSYVTQEQKTYYFFSDNIDADKSSIYAKIGKTLKIESDLSREVKITLKGKTGSAYENAFGVMNNSQAFGLVQNDTYLNVPHLKDNSIEIAPLYMERLHIICDCNEKIKTLEDLLLEYDKTEFHIGKAGSSSNILFPLLLEYYENRNQNINPTRKDNIVTSDSFGEMLDKITDSKNNEELNTAIFFMMGYNDRAKNILLADNGRLKLIKINPADIILINNEYNQEFLPTYFPVDFYEDDNVSTIGALATLIGSIDLSNKEISKFLELFEKVSANAPLIDIFNNPSFSVVDVSNKFKDLSRKNSWSVFKSILIFLVSVTISAYLSTMIILYIISSYKQSKYYTEMMEVYRSITDINRKKASTSNKFTVSQIQLENCDRLIDGVSKLNDLGQVVREDFNTGGMTINHHKYLLENLNYLTKWFQEKLTSRYVYAISGFQGKESKSKTKIKNQIHYLYGNSYLLKEQYEYLLTLL